MDVVFELGRIACSLAKIDNSKQKMIDVINNGKAYEIFEKMVYEHGGDINRIHCNYTDCIDIKANESGNIELSLNLLIQKKLEMLLIILIN